MTYNSLIPSFCFRNDGVLQQYSVSGANVTDICFWLFTMRMSKFTFCEIFMKLCGDFVFAYIIANELNRNCLNTCLSPIAMNVSSFASISYPIVCGAAM